MYQEVNLSVPTSFSLMRVLKLFALVILLEPLFRLKTRGVSPKRGGDKHNEPPYVFRESGVHEDPDASRRKSGCRLPGLLVRLVRACSSGKLGCVVRPLCWDTEVGMASGMDRSAY